MSTTDIEIESETLRNVNKPQLPSSDVLQIGFTDSLLSTCYLTDIRPKVNRDIIRGTPPLAVTCQSWRIPRKKKLCLFMCLLRD